ncbi:MAG: Lrp/AsnC family transcriptional regulator [Chloroflexi bacterium]|nr:Lrp/AsnC family transcriptional regulator [Chloroflexota bacterium]
MVKAYVLIEARAGASRNLLRNLGDKPSVVSASRVTGPYDIIAVVQEEDLEQVHVLVTEQIHSMQGVLRTTTMVAVG